MAKATWHIVADQIEQDTELGRGGRGIVDIYRIPYVIDSGPAAGHEGSVKVPADQIDPDRVAGLIQYQVDRVHDVGGLGSGRAGT